MLLPSLTELVQRRVDVTWLMSGHRYYELPEARWAWQDGIICTHARVDEPTPPHRRWPRVLRRWEAKHR